MLNLAAECVGTLSARIASFRPLLQYDVLVFPDVSAGPTTTALPLRFCNSNFGSHGWSSRWDYIPAYPILVRHATV